MVLVAKLGVTPPAVVEEIDVLEHCVGQLKPDSPLAAVQELERWELRRRELHLGMAGAQEGLWVGVV